MKLLDHRDLFRFITLTDMKHVKQRVCHIGDRHFLGRGAVAIAQ
jgi:hypothetical protein